MSLQPCPAFEIPEETRRVACAAFPRGTLCLRIADALGGLYQDADFADLFPRRGQPAASPARLAWVTILQFVENLSDRAAADAVRGRMDWKYLLGLDLSDPGFDHTVLSEFRARLTGGEAERRLLDTLLACLREMHLLKARGRQRTDSTHILAAVCTLNRLERVGETLRAALNAVADAAPDWLAALAPPSWYERYARRVENFRLPAAKSERERLAAEIGADGQTLLDAIAATPAGARRAALPRWARCAKSGSSNTAATRTLWRGARATSCPRWRSASNRPTTPKRATAPNAASIGSAIKST